MSVSVAFFRSSVLPLYFPAVICCFSLNARAEEQSLSEETHNPVSASTGSSSDTLSDQSLENKSTPAQPPAKDSSSSPTKGPANQNRMKQNRQGQTKANQQKQSQSPSKTPSVFFPDWPTNSFAADLRPVLGVEYLTEPRTNVSVLMAEFGAHFGVRGIPLVEGNPGLQIEPSIGYAWGQAVVKGGGSSPESGMYRRAWGAVRTPVYYHFVRQVFEGKYGQVSGGPLSTAKRASFQSDTGIAIVPHVSAHYTLTYERAYGEDSKSPELLSYDHWIHGRLSTSTLNFFVDVGPGYSISKSESDLGTLGRVEGQTSGAYLLGLSGFDLLPDKIGFEASTKYMFSSQTDVNFVGAVGRSPLEDLGAQAALTGLPADSLNASAFFGVRRLIGVFGIGWRYTLQILNFSEANNTKQQKAETNGFGVYASVRL